MKTWMKKTAKKKMIMRATRKRENGGRNKQAKRKEAHRELIRQQTL
jgi:hypothetical protein